MEEQAPNSNQREMPALSVNEEHNSALQKGNHITVESGANVNIPQSIAGQERIVRILYDPVHFKVVKPKKPSEVEQRILRFKAFEPPYNLDEISVTRLEYSSPDFCKLFGRERQKPEGRRNYYGLAVLFAHEIRGINAEVEHTPDYTSENYNPAHSDIHLGFILEKDKPVTAQQQLMMDRLAQVARVYKDEDITADVWNSGELI